MSLRHPFSITAVIAVFVTSLVLSAILAMQTAERTRADKRQQILQLRETEQSLIATLNQSFMKNMLGVYEKELGAPDSTQALEASDFSALGSFVQEDSKSWSADWYITRTPQFSREWFSQIEKSTAFENIKPGELTWLHLTSDSGQVEFGLATLVQVRAGEITKNKIIVAVSPSAILTSVSTLSKGVASQTFVVDREGYTYSYPEPQYVGAKIDSHPVVRALLDQSTSGANENVSDFRALDGSPILGAYEFIANSNLAVVVTSPRATVFQFITQFFIQTVLVTLGLVALTMIAFSTLLARDGHEKELLRQNLELAQRSREEDVSPSVGIGAKPVVSPNTSLHAVTNLQIKEIVKGVADYLRTPLTALLGQLQIAERQDSLPSVKTTLTPTIAEARRLRDFIENLCNEVELTPTKREVVEAVPILNQVIANYRALFEKYDIKFEENFQVEFSVRADIERVRSALSTLLLFTIENLSTTQNKLRRIVIRVEKLAGLGQILIEGYGRSLESEVKKQIFTPFKTRLHQGNLFGLDLVLAQSRIEDMQGEVFVENIDVESFRVVIRFATAMTVTADQVMKSSEMSESYPLAPELHANEMATVTGLAGKAEAETVEEPEAETESEIEPIVAAAFKEPEVQIAAFALQAEAQIGDVENDDLFIRKPKLRLDL
jgi:signal transduction histidine kinase